MDGVNVDGGGGEAEAGAEKCPILSRKERRELERQRREAARRPLARGGVAKQARTKLGGSAGVDALKVYQGYMRAEMARLKREQPTLRPQAIRRLAAAGWRFSPLNRGMGVIIGSAHQARGQEGA